MALEEMMWPFAGGMLGGAVGAMAIILIVIWAIMALAIYVYTSLALMKIAQRTKTPNAWLAWIPIGNIYLMTQMAGISGWWTLLILVGWIPFLGGLMLLAGFIYMWWIICPKVKKPEWWSILLIIPVVNLIIIGIMAWGK